MYLRYDESSSKPLWRPRHPVVASLDILAVLYVALLLPSLTGWVFAYAVVLVAMFAVSALHHWCQHTTWRHRLDRAVIYVLIGGTVLPYVLLIQLMGKIDVLYLLIVAVLTGVLIVLFGINAKRGRVATMLYLGTGLLSVWCMIGVGQYYDGAWSMFFWAGVALYGLQLWVYNQFRQRELQHVILFLAGPIIHLTLAINYAL